MMMLCSIKNADKSFKEIKDGIVNSGKGSRYGSLECKEKKSFDNMHSI